MLSPPLDRGEGVKRKKEEEGENCVRSIDRSSNKVNAGLTRVNRCWAIVIKLHFTVHRLWWCKMGAGWTVRWICDNWTRGEGSPNFSINHFSFDIAALYGLKLNRLFSRNTWFLHDTTQPRRRVVVSREFVFDNNNDWINLRIGRLKSRFREKVKPGPSTRIETRRDQLFCPCFSKRMRVITKCLSMYHRVFLGGEKFVRVSVLRDYVSKKNMDHSRREGRDECFLNEKWSSRYFSYRKFLFFFFLLIIFWHLLEKNERGAPRYFIQGGQRRKLSRWDVNEIVETLWKKFTYVDRGNRLEIFTLRGGKYFTLGKIKFLSHDNLTAIELIIYDGLSMDTRWLVG